MLFDYLMWIASQFREICVVIKPACMYMPTCNEIFVWRLCYGSSSILRLWNGIAWLWVCTLFDWRIVLTLYVFHDVLSKAPCISLCLHWYVAIKKASVSGLLTFYSALCNTDQRIDCRSWLPFELLLKMTTKAYDSFKRWHLWWATFWATRIVMEINPMGPDRLRFTLVSTLSTAEITSLAASFYLWQPLQRVAEHRHVRGWQCLR